MLVLYIFKFVKASIKVKKMLIKLYDEILFKSLKNAKFVVIKCLSVS